MWKTDVKPVVLRYDVVCDEILSACQKAVCSRDNEIEVRFEPDEDRSA